MTEKHLSEMKLLNREIALDKSHLCSLEAELRYSKSAEIRSKIKLLQTKIEAKIKHALALYDEINDFISSIDDALIRLIISLRFINNLTWEEIALHIGSGITSDGVRKSYSRFANSNL
jgi:hypothetical protein